MNYSEEDLEYFRGTKFSNGYRMELGCNPLYDRLESILQIVEGKNVLHIGCCDHLTLIKEKIEQRRWLHGLLDEKCQRVIGVDINTEAVEYVNSNGFSKESVISMDVAEAGSMVRLPKIKYDYVVLGEILEHVDDPVSFLSRLRENFISVDGFSDSRLVITVPNAFVFLKGEYKKGIEAINSDHRYWFTPYTIGKVMVQAHITPIEYRFAGFSNAGNVSNKLTKLFFRALQRIRHKPSSFRSYRGDSLVVIGKPER